MDVEREIEKLRQKEKIQRQKEGEIIRKTKKTETDRKRNKDNGIHETFFEKPGLNQTSKIYWVF